MSGPRLFTQEDVVALDLLNDKVLSNERVSKFRKYLCEFVEPVEIRKYFEGKLETVETIFQEAIEKKSTLESVADAIEFGAGEKELARELRDRAALR